jgi:D-hydroxyproline dehydrogenase subunit alpha
MRTSVPGVFVAGEATGIGGADLARVEGTLAGRSAAAAAHEQTGRMVGGRRRGLRRRRAHAAGFAAVLEDLFGARPGVLALAEPDTPLCRCEDVTAGAIDAAVAAGAGSLAALKIATRCGQGPCQGRVCEPLVASRLPAPAVPERFTVRSPLRPVELPLLIGQRTDGPKTPAS